MNKKRANERQDKIQHRRQQKTHDLANIGDDMDRARRTDWSASEMQDGREKFKHSSMYAVHFHEDAKALEDRTTRT